MNDLSIFFSKLLMHKKDLSKPQLSLVEFKACKCIFLDFLKEFSFCMAVLQLQFLI